MEHVQETSTEMINHEITLKDETKIEEDYIKLEIEEDVTNIDIEFTKTESKEPDRAECPTIIAESPTYSAESPTNSAESPTNGAKSPTNSNESPTNSAESPTKSAESPTNGDPALQQCQYCDVTTTYLCNLRKEILIL